MKKTGSCLRQAAEPSGQVEISKGISTANNDTASTLRIYKRQEMNTKWKFLSYYACWYELFLYLCKSNSHYGNNEYYFKIWNSTIGKTSNRCLARFCNRADARQGWRCWWDADVSARPNSRSDRTQLCEEIWNVASPKVDYYWRDGTFDALEELRTKEHYNRKYGDGRSI